MASAEFLQPPKPAPPLNVPQSSSTVRVSAIDSSTRLRIPFPYMFTPMIKGHDAFFAPSYSFLVSNVNRHVLFDLGVRKDLSKGPPSTPERIKKLGWTCETEQDVAEILDQHASNTGIGSKDIEAIILSHHHFDHTGNLSLFPASTEVIVGPGFKKEHLPGYPSDPKSTVYGPEFESRSVREIEPGKDGLQIGRFSAADYFGDGSFYLLSVPGHTNSHVCGFARVTASPATFVFMGADAAHHCGLIRPSQYLPLPKSIVPAPFPRLRPGICPGELLQKVHPNQSVATPFYSPKPGYNQNDEDTMNSVEKITELDALDNVFTVIAHDFYLLEHLPLFPETMNGWYARGLDSKTRWEFARDFEDPESGSQ